METPLSGLALFEKIETEKASGKVLVAEIAPAVRVAIGELFGKPPGQNMERELRGMLHSLGFDHVIETPLGADICTYYEALRLKRELEKGEGKFPMYNSCCIGWRMYARAKHPELKDSINILASPQMALGAVAQEYLAQKKGVPHDKSVIVGIMPCTLKKNETTEVMKNGQKYVDYVVTTVELAQWAKMRGKELEKGPARPEFLPGSSAAGMRFGVSGGMSNSVLAALAKLCGTPLVQVDLKEDGAYRSVEYEVMGKRLKIAIVQGFVNFEKLYSEIKAGKEVHLVEVMMCPFGCVGGPGQPPANMDTIRMRRNGLADYAATMRNHTAFESPGIDKLRKDFLDALPMEKIEEMIFLNRY
jgi:iron only hydrogenase large subunit-like protein